MSIKIEVSANTFIDMYGESEYCRSFTLEAKEAILEHIEEMQDEYGATIDWTEVFMNAAEYTAKELINEYDSSYVDLIDSLSEDDVEFLANEIFDNIDGYRHELDNGNYVIF